MISYLKAIFSFSLILVFLSACAEFATNQRYQAVGDVGKEFDGASYYDHTYRYFSDDIGVSVASMNLASKRRSVGPFFLPIFPPSFDSYMDQKKDWSPNENIILEVTTWSKQPKGSVTGPWKVDISKIELMTDGKTFKPESIQEDRDEILNRSIYKIIFPVKSDIQIYKVSGIQFEKNGGEPIFLPEYEFRFLKTTDYQIYLHK